ncbi:hypothetical protein K469DRAFT_803209 [Zopfia rhizophila CBS 207.26]|uniref:Uncharacterized protein n=1 Tax=Zopfia rhizophila CBS 207.26 TaxID=1314779 RepID=A0A6A6DJ18_9PEZI|nr:hypothetical protein K469DRAFT_803209 [Zopfia rhizophila CBS 207.26]
MPALVQQLRWAMQFILDLASPSGKALLIGLHFCTRWLERNPDCRCVKQKPQEVTCLACSTEEVYSATTTTI